MCAVLMLVGCAGWAAEAPRLTYAGSTTVGTILTHVLPGKIAVSAAGSATAVSELVQRRAELVGLSRALTDDDRQTIAAARGALPVVTTLGYGAVALFVQRTNPVTGMTRVQLAEACAGRLRWGDLGAPAPLATMTIQVVANHLKSGSTRLFADVILGGALPGLVRCEAVGSSVVQAAAIDDAVLAIASLHQDTPAIKPLALDGVLPTPETVRDGTYVLARPLVLVSLPETPGVAPLIAQLTTDLAVKQLRDEGVIPAPTAP